MAPSYSPRAQNMPAVRPANLPASRQDHSRLGT